MTLRESNKGSRVRYLRSMPGVNFIHIWSLEGQYNKILKRQGRMTVY